VTKSDVLALLGDSAYTGKNMHERILPLLVKAQELGVWPQLAPLFEAFLKASELHLVSMARLQSGLIALGTEDEPPKEITWN